MRLRNIPGSKEEILQYPYVVPDPLALKGHWAELYGNSHPLRLEIGMGKGRFLMEMADRYSDVNFLGMEMYSSVLLRAIQRREKRRADAPGGTDPFPHLLYARMDARELPDAFAPGEIDRIYLNFSDPWPKARHADRRLTSGRFLGRYRQVLLPGARIEFKTDNHDLFEFSVQEAQAAGWDILTICRDLHHDAALMQDNVLTEYEEKFSSLGVPICKMVLAVP